MSNAHLSTAPLDPYQWQESVLSTRSLSYLSTADVPGSPGFPPPGISHSRNPSASQHRPPTRRSTLTDESDYVLEMGGADMDRELNDILEMPESVVDSPLFMLPKEIRVKIFQFCLTAENGWPLEWPVASNARGLQPHILRTCKIIHAEAAPLLYTCNMMTFHHPSDANMFVRACTSPILAQHISNLSLHIKAQDTRLWMQYITSRDMSRSLIADFPHLKELSVRFRSNKWQHSLPPESNMKLWCEDSRLDEIVDGLRHVFMPDGPQAARTEEELENFISARPPASSLDPSDPAYKKQWLEIQKARAAFVARQALIPTIRVVCTCRVYPNHFAQLTTDPPVPPQPDAVEAGDAVQAGDAAEGFHGGPANASPEPLSIPLRPARDGEPFRGFSPVDFRQHTTKLHDPEIGSANVARTPFADKAGILISLEILCIDSKRDNPEARNV